MLMRRGRIIQNELLGGGISSRQNRGWRISMMIPKLVTLQKHRCVIIIVHSSVLIRILLALLLLEVCCCIWQLLGCMSLVMWSEKLLCSLCATFTHHPFSKRLSLGPQLLLQRADLLQQFRLSISCLLQLLDKVFLFLFMHILNHIYMQTKLLFDFHLLACVSLILS